MQEFVRIYIPERQISTQDFGNEEDPLIIPSEDSECWSCFQYTVAVVRSVARLRNRQLSASLGNLDH